MKTKFRSALPAAAVAGIAACLLAACSQSATKSSKSALALACQTRACACEAVKAELFGKKATADVKWRLNGDAYCADGFVLKRIDGN